MRAAVLHTPGDIRLEEVPEPRLKDGHVIVRVPAVGVCGSDLPRLLTKGAHRMPLICGHEFAGIITAVGDGVDGFAEGELVAIPPMIPCRRCDQCQTGNFSRCRDYDYFGSRRDGAYAEYVAIPADNLLKTPAGIDPTAVAMTDPASIALHAIWKAPFAVGKTGAVVGCGAIGLFAVQWLKMMGAGDIHAVDLSQQKLDLAKQAGATHTWLPQDAPTGVADLVVEAAGHPESQSTAILMAGPGGHAVFIGIPTVDTSWPAKVFQHILRQEVSLHGAWNSFGAPFPGPQWTVSLEKLGTGELRWDFIVSHDLDLAELPAMFDSFKVPGTFFSKVIFRP